MLGRLGFAGRIMAIVLLAFLAIQAIGTGIGYMARKTETAGDALLLLPERAGIIVDLIETAGAGQRDDLIKALGSEDLKVSVTPDRPPALPGSQRLSPVEWVMSQYLPDASEREVVALITPEPGPRWTQLHFGQYWLSSRQPLYISIPLKTGGYVLFETRGDIAPRVFGLPPGFFIGALGAAVGIAALLAIWRESRPVRALSSAVAAFTGESAPDPVTPEGAPEIRKLIAAVNDMQARIAALVKGRTVLLGAISHDLKTYITRLRLRAEMMSDDERRERTVRDLDDMAMLIEDALAVARGAAVSDRREEVDLIALANAEAAERPRQSVSIDVQGDGSRCAVTGDPMALRRLMTNLVGNALRYGTRCRIEAKRQGAEIALNVDDDGPGISVDERETVFEPFYRIEQSRNRATGGSGLGLAIARQIVEAHGGRISIATSPLGGARFTLTLPAA